MIQARAAIKRTVFVSTTTNDVNLIYIKANANANALFV